MPDMLVKLYDLPLCPPCKALQREGIDIRRALPPDKHIIIEWVRGKFGNGWASECDVSFANKPASCFIAVRDKKVIGFACYEATCRDFFGPTGVDEEYRGLGIGTQLLYASLQAMKEMGYAYAIIGGAGPVDFYAKSVNATVIPDSVPGIYKTMI